MFEPGVDLMQPSGWLPLVFALVMALSMLAYVILDGYDLGVGALLDSAESVEQKDMMIASIGPFWDANETWLVLGVGVLLVGFPMAHGIILGALYLPVALMLVALSLRGVAFDFRVKSKPQHQPFWNKAFYAASSLASWSQGFMLGQLITGFKQDSEGYLFSALIGFCLVFAYRLLGAGWLIMKSEGALQLLAVNWAKQSLWLTAAGVAAISVATPWVSQRIFEKWFSMPNFMMLLPIPAVTVALFWFIWRSLSRLPTRFAQGHQNGAAIPFAATVGIFLLSFLGLAYSLFPWLVIDKLNIWQAASSPEALMVIFYGVVVVLPVIIGYTVFAYRVFWGKSTQLRY
ncbi:MAG: cytochrome d ubiquinol oxidase subunit II [Betaproteobacteria bacterium]|nr:cytochrome d ubiquinol oxidase subunit II [Betaproteobacteria bacterium]NBY05738.1 cytochrome d ubiquinol oxidase subunit II [Betaproteobacteria bacterium]